jgi:hypothetical protein
MMKNILVRAGRGDNDEAVFATALAARGGAPATALITNGADIETGGATP